MKKLLTSICILFMFMNMSFTKVEAESFPCSGTHLDSTKLDDSCFDIVAGHKVIKAGKYYLDGNYGDGSFFEINEGMTVEICLNGNILKNQIINHGTLKISDCKHNDVSHKYITHSERKYLVLNDSATSGYETINGGAITGVEAGLIKGAGIHCAANSKTYISNINIIGNVEDDLGSAIYANNSECYLDNVLIKGNHANYVTSLGGAIVSYDSYMELKNCVIENNIGINNINHPCAILLDGSSTGSGTMLLKGNTTITNNHLLLDDSSLVYAGVMVNPDSNNRLDFESDFSGTVDMEVYYKKENSSIFAFPGTISSSNTISYKDKLSFSNSNDFSSYYIVNDTTDNSLKFISRLLEEPTTSNNYTYKILEDGYNTGSKSVSYQWLTSNIETKTFTDTYYSSINFGTKTIAGFQSSPIAAARLVGQFIDISLNNLVTEGSYITFTCDNTNLSSTSGTLTRDDNEYKYVPKNSNFSVIIRGFDAPSYEIKNVVLHLLVKTKVDGQTTNHVSNLPAGTYYCEAYFKTGATLDKTYTSTSVNFMEMKHLEDDDFNVDKSGEGYGEMVVKKTKDSTVHLVGINMQDLIEDATIKCDGSVLDSSNYKIKDGSLKIIFLKNYLDTLNVGNHKLTINLKTSSGSYNFTVNLKIKDDGSTPSYHVVDTSTK